MEITSFRNVLTDLSLPISRCITAPFLWLTSSSSMMLLPRIVLKLPLINTDVVSFNVVSIMPVKNKQINSTMSSSRILFPCHKINSEIMSFNISSTSPRPTCRRSFINFKTMSSDCPRQSLAPTSSRRYVSNHLIQSDCSVFALRIRMTGTS